MVDLALADNNGKISETGSNNHDEATIKEVFIQVLTELHSEKEKEINIMKLISGQEVMKLFELGSGPVVGRVRKQINEILLEDEGLKKVKDAVVAKA